MNLRMTLTRRSFGALAGFLPLIAGARLRAVTRPTAFDAMFYANSPAPESYGAERLVIAYEHNSFGGGGTELPFWDDLTSEDMPSQARVDAVLSRYRSYSGMICLDIERWNRWGPGGMTAGRRALGLYLELLSRCRTSCPNASFGYYNMGPTIYSGKYYSARWNPIALDSIRRQNDLFEPLTTAQDALFPSCYTVDVSEEHWFSYARIALDECTRLNPTKPRVPFLCPRYINIPRYRNTHISGDLLRRQMEFCLRHGSGFVIWGGGPMYVDFQSDWWCALSQTVANLGSMSTN
jgi:hypothetical protein